MYDKATPAERRAKRLEYIDAQGGNCCCCEKPLSGDAGGIMGQKRINAKLFPGGFFDHPVHLHHDHNSGLTIGAVHAKCNAYLWQYKGE